MTDETPKVLIPEHLHGQRVDKALAEIYPNYSRSKLTQWLKEGVITINNSLYKPDDKVFGNEEVNFKEIPIVVDSRMVAENIPLEIVFEDEYVLVINKQAGLVVHPGAGNLNHTLVNALINHDPNLAQLPRAGIIHRLDKDTTGLLIVAKNLEAHTYLTREMQERNITREYLTLVQGHLISGATINTNYGRDPKNRLKMCVAKSGREAITTYRIAKHYNFATLLNVQLLTGRTHQIRVHMAHINHAVIGDTLYQSRAGIRKGASPQIREHLQQFKRQALHAIRISFTHPVSNETISCEASIPNDFKELLNILDNDNEQHNC
jgi:23S rRNA pseudouridine1911/1915/1917 synthase